MIITSFPSWIIFELCFTGNICNRKTNQPWICLHLSRTVFYTHYLSFWWHGLQKREFYQEFFSLFLILIHCWIDIRFLEFYIQQFNALLENRLIISWLAFAWSLKHLLLSEFTFVNQAFASSSKSPSWKSNKTKNIQNKIKCLFQLLC